MAFFQNSVLNKHLKGQDTKTLNAAYQKFTAYFHNQAIQQNISLAKEEQFQEGFLRELFVNILGYTLNPQPNYNLTTELKNEIGAKKCDGAILQDGKALAVIELKGTDTKDLDKINVQAFNYKNNQTACVYVITSNFEKLRFFIHHSVEHLEFNLFTLSETEFKILWLCLRADNLLNGVPLKVKEDSLLAEENISKQLYKDYSAFKTDLWQNMYKNHPEHEQLMLFKKTQKLLDRFLFIFFSEDSGLLPPNSISMIIEKWKQDTDWGEDRMLYDIYKQYFGFINTGRPARGGRAEIFAFNGGLFQDDLILDNIKIDDEILLKHTEKLTAYDFQSEVDVNILGHIFENSLSEIENITAELEGQAIDKSKTKRKKDGVFYTPKYITKYIVDNTIGKLCKEEKIELNITDERFGQVSKRSRKGIADLQLYREWLLDLKICDPACGSGAFLNQALEFLIEEHRYLDELSAQYHKTPLVLSDIETQILEQNIYGVDINDESVEIAKLSLWLRTAQKGRKLTILNNNIKCGNSLIDDPEVAGEKAFNWEKEFPEVFKLKEKVAWHITTATHNSRYSQRMFDNYVKSGKAVWIDEENEILVSETIADIVKEDKLNVIEYNICGDHIHMLLVCEKDELTKIVGKIKGISGRKYNIANGITTTTTRGHVPLSGIGIGSSNSDIGSSSSSSNIDTSSDTEKKKYNSLWTQKFGKRIIKGENDLQNVINYIHNNRQKHGLPENKKLDKIISQMCCTAEYAFRTEYKGGFDVVIGNPPYVNFANLPKEEREFFKKTSKVCKNKTDLYAFFVEIATKILKQNGRFSFIFPHTWVSTTSFTPLRKLFFDNYKINNLVELEHGVFHDAIVKTVIIVCEKGSDFIGVPIFNEEFKFVVDIPKSIIFNDEEMIINFDWTPQKQKIEDKLFKDSLRLDYLLRFTRGIKTSNDKRFLYLEKKDEDYKKVIRGRNIKAYRTDFVGEYVWYRPDLMKEKVGCLPHTKELFEVPEKLITQRVNSSGQLLVTYDNQQYYCLDTTNVSVIENELEVNIKYILVLLNSRLINWWFNDKFKMPTISGYELHQIPIKIDKKIEAIVVDFGNEKLKQEPIFQNSQTKFGKYLKSQFQIEKLQKKLQNWHELDFGEFIKELNKAIKKVGGEKLSKMDEMEWIEVFETKKAEAQTLKAEIDKTDAEIDRMVYELYGLSEEEIKIVEQN
ncbi:MAG: N-6 DNA methylase [Bacteroidetes bacterium]|jgi:type I restriction-modification system DNA methylase subunit|nr:N-6 DNA methylase [Bacteroidota bacterium]MBT6685224.1 N-6 DNA methylase [Bacteroidota bacterium]MBT7142292.1 N-6 DNA methylase [Bacteroidota bacterium]MBT7492250.1 N-6 DNA methylase [Bacteroidota bacterium]